MLAVSGEARAIQVRDFTARGAPPGNVRQLMRQSTSDPGLLWTEEHCGQDGNAVLPSVRVPAGRDRCHLRQDGTGLSTEPRELGQVRVRDLRARYCFMRERALIVCLDDEIDLVPPVVGAAMINACLGAPAHRRTGSYRVLAEAAFVVLISYSKSLHHDDTL